VPSQLERGSRAGGGRRRIIQCGHDGVGEIPGALSNEEVFTCNRRDAFEGTRCCDKRGPACHSVQNLVPHARAHADGGDHGGSPPIEGPNIPHVGEEFPSHGLNEAAELIGREAADDPETSVRTPSTDPRPDVGADPSNAIRIRFPRKRADEGHR